MFAAPQLDFDNPANINHFYTRFFKYHTNTFIGEGFKKTNQYESLITEQELLQQRNEFWETRIQGNQDVWGKLREVLNMDDENAKVTLEEANIIMVDNNIQIVYDMYGYMYAIPIFVINLPAFYVQLKNETQNQDFEEKILTFKIRSIRWDDDLIVTYNNKNKVDQLMEELRIKENLQNIRLFLNGKEMKKDQVFGNYDISDESIVQAFLS